MVTIKAFQVASYCCTRLLLTDHIKFSCTCVAVEMVVVGKCGHLGSWRYGKMQGLRLKKGIYHLLSDPMKYRGKVSSA